MAILRTDSNRRSVSRGTRVTALSPALITAALMVALLVTACSAVGQLANQDSGATDGKQVADPPRAEFTEARARALLAAAAAAVQKLTSVRMEIGKSLTVYSDDGDPKATFAYSGTGLLSRAPGVPIWEVRLRCEYSSRENGAAAVLEKAAYDGDILRMYTATSNDGGERVFDETLIGPALMDARRFGGACGSFNWASPTLPNTYINGSFLSVPKKGNRVAHLGFTPVGSTICELVLVEWVEGPRVPYRYVEHFAIDPKTNLPMDWNIDIYKQERLWKSEAFSIARIEVNPPVSDADFVLKPPPGYKVSREDHRGPPLGRVVGNWRLRDAKGGQHMRKRYLGRVLVLDFWATWCAPCRRTMPEIQALHNRYKDDDRVRVLGVSCMEKEGADPAATLGSAGFSYLTLLEGDPLARMLNVKAVPTLAVIGTDGKVIYGNVGYKPGIGKEVERVIAAHLAK